MRTWEEKVKFKFGNSTGRDCYEVSVHGVPDNDETNVEDGFHTMETFVHPSHTAGFMLTMFREDVEKIFDPIVDRIVALVKQQVSDVERKGENVAV